MCKSINDKERHFFGRWYYVNMIYVVVSRDQNELQNISWSACSVSFVVFLIFLSYKCHFYFYLLILSYDILQWRNFHSIYIICTIISILVITCRKKPFCQNKFTYKLILLLLLSDLFTFLLDIGFPMANFD